VPDDAFGWMVREFHRDGLAGQPQYRRLDGTTAEAHLQGYFRGADDWHAVERRLLAAADGRVLDAGCGVGRHALPLADRGHDVVGFDRSPGAVTVARERGVPAAVGDLTRPPTVGPFDTVLALGKQAAVGERVADLRTTLDALAAVTRPGGRLLADFDDPSRWGGDGTAGDAAVRRFRVEYDGLVGPWTDLLVLSPDRLRRTVADTPWRVRRLVDGDGSLFGAELALHTGRCR